MEQVSDSVFRQILIQTGKPDLFFTEFVNVEGLVSRGRKNIIHRLQFTPQETPIIAQIWGKNPDNFYTIATQIASMGFAGIDINMGCPERGIVKRGCCAGYINNPEEASAVIAATKAGAGHLPVSVKTRCGTNSWVTEEWASHLLQQNLAALTIHGRIAKDMSTKPADWDEIAKVVALRDNLAPNTKIIGNGDIESYREGLEKIANYNLGGVMIGRGIFTNLWIFNPEIDPLTITHTQKLQLLYDHLKLYNQTWGESKNFDQMKKFYKCYINDLPHATDIRSSLMERHTAHETLDFLETLIVDLASGNSDLGQP